MNFIVSETAAEKLRGIITGHPEKFAGIRLYVRGMGCSGIEYGMAMLEAPGEEDQFFPADGITFVVDPTSLQYVEGCVIDWLENSNGQGFTVRNPLHRASCGSQRGTQKSCKSCTSNN